MSKAQQEQEEREFYQGLFDRVHHAGATRHPRRWFLANEKAAHAVAQVKGRRDDLQLKTLASLVALRVLDAVIDKENR